MEHIPRVIHYCWFGGAEKSKLMKKCIESWRIYLPDYEIVEWNESNFDIELFTFTKDAYKEKKWAFVADYCRVWVLYNYGGIYLDTDMEVLKNMDIFLNNEAFAGQEDEITIAAGILGSKKNNEFIYKIIQHYNLINFKNYKDKVIEITIPNIITKLAYEEGYKKSDSITTIDKYITIYPKEYFYPKRNSWERADISKNTYAIHHYEGTWRSKRQILRSRLKQHLINIFGYDRIINTTNLLKGNKLKL